MTRAKIRSRAEKRPVNNRVSLSLIFISGPFFKGEADARPGVDQFDRLVLVDLFPEIVDIYVDEIGACVEGSLPYFFGNFCAGKYTAAVLHHIEQQFEFLRAQVDLDAAAGDDKGAGVQFQVNDLQYDEGLRLQFALAFGKRPDPGVQLPEVDGLDQVVIGSSIQSPDFIVYGAEGGQLDDGNIRLYLAEVFA